MQNILKNKRLFATLLAGILLITAALGAGTYAWFTDNSSANSINSYQTGRIYVNAGNVNLASYEFQHNDSNAGAMQTSLENFYKSTPAGDPSAIFDNLNAQRNNGTLNANNLKKNVNMVGSNPMVTPGCLLESTIPFSVLLESGLNPPSTSWSSIPVYFRIAAAELENVDPNIKLKTLDNITANFKKVSNFGAVLTDHTQDIVNEVGSIKLVKATDSNGKDWYYCNIPIMNGYNDYVEITVQNYVVGSANDDAVENDKTFTFGAAGGVGVEIIQATNNAVWFADDWADVAVNNFFVAYDDISGIKNLYVVNP